MRILEGLSETAGTAVRLSSLAVAIVIALFVAACFLCAAAFVFVLDNYGPVQACLAGAALFFVVALIATGSYMAYRRKLKRQAAEAARSARQSLLADPMLLATGIHVARAIGIKRLIPILAVGGIALGFMASRTSADPNASTKPNPAE